MSNKKFSIRFDERTEAYIVIVTETNEATAMFGNKNHAEMFMNLLNKDWSIVTASVDELEQELEDINNRATPRFLN